MLNFELLSFLIFFALSFLISPESKQSTLMSPMTEHHPYLREHDDLHVSCTVPQSESYWFVFPVTSELILYSPKFIILVSPSLALPPLSTHKS